MESIVLALFIPACFALNLTPGPNNLLAMNNAKNYGFRMAFLAGLGRLLAFAIMIALAGYGLASILYASETLFSIIKFVGAGYLFWIAYKLWRSDNEMDGQPQGVKLSVIGLARQEFLLASGNPKAILIFTAFLPQFVDPDYSVHYQFLILGMLFLVLEWVAIAGYACFGLYLRRWFSKPELRKLFNRGCSGMLATAGIGLLFARRD
jgi:threonine/homoserine/homoserine lactone efflux protein